MTRGGTLRNHRILLAEDEILIALDLEFSLRDAGACQVEIAVSLDEALKIVDRELISAAIIDYRLGTEEGAPLATRLCERNIPFLIHTGHADTRELSRMWPRAAVIRKPALPGSVVATLISLIDGMAGGQPP